MKVLFVCNQNQRCGKTAELLFKSRHETKSAGLFSKRPLNEKALSWADVVVVMEDSQRVETGRRFPRLYMQKRIISLGIPDMFSFNQPELVEILKLKFDCLL